MRSYLLLTALVLACSVPPQSPGQTADAFAERYDFDGVILVARADSVVHLQGYGTADRSGNEPTTPATRYQLGSISKWVSTVVVLTLVDRGLLDLDAPIGEYVSGLPVPTAERVTLHHLVAHTSGVPNGFLDAYHDDPGILDRQMTAEQAARRFASGGLAFEPGERYDYSHANWILVQAAVESVTRRPFADVVREVLIEPLGLSDTGVFSGTFADVPRAAVGYTRSGDALERWTTPQPVYAAAMGGVYGTASDLLALVRAVYGGAVLSSASRERLTTVVVPRRDYAYGGRVRALGSDTAAWLTGSNGPFKSRIAHVPRDGRTVITLSNTGTPPERTERLAEILLASL